MAHAECCRQTAPHTKSKSAMENVGGGGRCVYDAIGKNLEFGIYIIALVAGDKVVSPRSRCSVLAKYAKHAL